jgi:hypothetical protein
LILLQGLEDLVAASPHLREVKYQKIPIDQAL